MVIVYVVAAIEIYQNKIGRSKTGYFILIALVVHSILIFFINSNKKTIPYLSLLAVDKKAEVLEKLVKEYKSYQFEKNDGCCEFSITVREPGFMSMKNTSYSNIIIYDQSGYYLNCKVLIGQSYTMSDDMTDEMIDKIKHLEIETRII